MEIGGRGEVKNKRVLFNCEVPKGGTQFLKVGGKKKTKPGPWGLPGMGEKGGGHRVAVVDAGEVRICTKNRKS